MWTQGSNTPFFEDVSGVFAVFVESGLRPGSRYFLTKTANTLGASPNTGSLHLPPSLHPPLKGCRHDYNGPHALSALSVT